MNKKRKKPDTSIEDIEENPDWIQVKRATRVKIKVRRRIQDSIRDRDACRFTSVEKASS